MMKPAEQPSKGEIDVQREGNMRSLCSAVIETLKVKNPKYGDSWKAYGGFSAFMNLARKWSRVENLAKQYHYDIFAALEATHGQPDGMLEALADLMGYDILVLDEMLYGVGDGYKLKSAGPMAKMPAYSAPATGRTPDRPL
jgi:hypothetical protein